MNEVGAARINVITDARGMRRGNMEVKRESQVLKNTLMSARKYVLAFASAYAGLRAFRGIREQMRVVDDAAKKSRKLGMLTEELIALRHAATQSGLGLNTFDMAMQRVTRRVSEAAKGTGEAKAAIAELGLDPRELVSVGPAKTLYAIADALTKVKNPADKLRLAFKLFDSEGAALVNMLDRGSEGLEAYREEAAALGILLSNKDAMGVEEANDAIDSMHKSLTSIGRDIAVDVAPAFKLFADTVVELQNALRDAGGFGSSFAEAMSGARVAILEVMAAAYDSHDALKEFMPFIEPDGIYADQFHKAAEAERQRFAGRNGKGTQPAAARAQFGGADGIVVQQIKIEYSEATKKFFSLLDSMKEEKQKLELGDFEASLAQLQKMKGFNSSMLDQLTVAHAEIEGIKKADKIIADIKDAADEIARGEVDAAQRIRDGMKTENDILMERIIEIEKLNRVGALSDADAKKALAGIKSEGASGGATTGQFLKSGSREAYNAIARAMSGSPEKREERMDRKNILAAAEKVAATIDKLAKPAQMIAVKGEI